MKSKILDSRLWVTLGVGLWVGLGILHVVLVSHDSRNMILKSDNLSDSPRQVLLEVEAMEKSIAKFWERFDQGLLEVGAMEKSIAKFWERFDWLVEHREDTFHANMLGEVFRKAQGGNVEAIRYLEGKGLLVFPGAEDRK